MSDSSRFVLRRGAVGSAVVAALVLLGSFYSVVSGAVHRASHARSSLLATAVTAAHR
ncbi:MAG: hypothetical protein M3Z16_11215 [Pseudomonadota bacterium]|nr:hypothetical protein [Pseudomonadota bacterium]